MRSAPITTGTVDVSGMKGKEISPGVFLLETPTPVKGTNKLRALADVHGMLAVIELAIKF